MQPMKQERSLGGLFSELAGETSTPVRQEVAPAKTELTQKAARDTMQKVQSVAEDAGRMLQGGGQGQGQQQQGQGQGQGEGQAQAAGQGSA